MKITLFGPLLLSTLLGALAAKASASPKAYLIGGGSAIDSSQNQIELNVAYARQSLEKQGYQTELWFSDGDAPEPDVHQIHYERLAQASPLSRITGMLEAEITEYRNHQLERVQGNTRRQTLYPALESRLEAAGSEDQILLLYNGHGKKSTQGLAQHTLELWQGDTLTVADLSTLFAQSPAGQLRYLMTQCYSGAFHEVVNAKPIPTDGSTAPICGFSAVSPHKMSEGCSASLALQDYRDYTTGFFAAINGVDRLDIPVKRKADFNLDKLVTPLEAHWYTLGYVDSTDIAWSSSEYYLQQWQPWSLRWIAQDADIEYENIYARLASFNARRAGFTQKGLALVQALRVEQERLNQAQAELEQAFSDNERRQVGLQNALIDDLSQRWPSLFAAYTRAHNSLIQTELEQINQTIRQDPRYRELSSLQDALPTLMRQALQLEREQARIERVFHLRHMARLLNRFKRFAQPQHQAQYQALQQCEASPLS